MAAVKHLFSVIFIDLVLNINALALDYFVQWPLLAVNRKLLSSGLLVVINNRSQSALLNAQVS